VFQALADPTRRAIVKRLSLGPALVTELAAPFDMSLNAVSKHLRVLERAGLLRRDVRGREHHCALEAAPLEGAAEWIAFYRRFWQGKLDTLETLLIERGEARPAPRPGGSRVKRPRR
jgi:DNA-binding transcriptional ArsR family regulator